MERRNRIRLAIFCTFLMGLGLYLVISGFREVYHTQHNIADENTFPLNPNPVVGPFLTNQYVYAIGTTFMTNDIFSVNNRIDGQIQVYLKGGNDIISISGIVLGKQNNNLYNMDEKTLNETIQFYSDNKMLFSNGKLQKPNIYELNFTFTSEGEEAKTIWVFLRTSDGKWYPYNGPDFPTIAPASAWIQLKNSKVVEGLTWVIVGFIPIGLVSELCILYFIERHFHDLDKSKKSDEIESKKITDPNYFHDG